MPKKRRKNPGHLHYLEDVADQGFGDFEEHYPASASGKKKARDPYHGRNVVWDGVEGRMLRVSPNYATHISGNIFYPDKLASVRDGIVESDHKVVFDAPYGTASRVGRDDIAESQQYWEDEGIDSPLSTGDEELDEYLKLGPEEFMDTHFNYLDPDEDEEYAEELDRLESEVAEAEASGDGDFGAWTFDIRDGNHRAFGSFLAGEPHIYMILEDNQFQYLDPSVEEDAELLDMLE